MTWKKMEDIPINYLLRACIYFCKKGKYVKIGVIIFDPLNSGESIVTCNTTIKTTQWI